MTASSGKIRVLIAEDSEAMRNALQSLLSLDPRILVVGAAADGEQAVAMARSLRPDVITMDVVMPRIDGVEATSLIMQECPARILMVTAHADDRQIDLSFRAIAAGALEVVAKPAAASPDELRAWATRVCDAIVLMGEVPVITRSRRTAVHAARRIDAIGIAASTGGPLALAQILGALPANLGLPIVVAQHIAEGFTEGLVRWLRTVTPLPVVTASANTTLRPGHVYFPPDRCDIAFASANVLHTPPSTGRHTPSCDALLGSMAATLRARAAGIVLTGMGDDGAAGLLAIRDAGGTTMAQSAESCVVFGMPQAARNRGATYDLRSLEGITEAIVDLARAKR